MNNVFDRICIAVLLTGAATRAATAEQPVDFNRDIRPLLAKNCFACHGPDEGSRKAELRLDSFVGATSDLGGRRALVIGKPDENELILRIESDERLGKTASPPVDRIRRRVQRSLVIHSAGKGGSSSGEADRLAEARDRPLCAGKA